MRHRQKTLRCILGTVGETFRRMLGIRPPRWSEVGRKVKRIIELDPPL